MGRPKLKYRAFEYTKCILEANSSHFKLNLRKLADDAEAIKEYNPFAKFWRENQFSFDIEVKIKLKNDEDYQALNAFINNQNEERHELSSERHDNV